MKNLIIYYSRKGQNYVSGAIKYLKKGNTEIVAEYIKEAVGGDLFEVDTIEAYPEDYTECTNVAKQELHSHARPEAKAYLESIDEYDNIFVGYPNWWGTMPMVMYTFLEHYDFTGKNLIPFCTNEGSGLGGSVREIKKLCPTAHVKDGLSIHGTVAKNSKDRVTQFAINSL